MCKRRCESRCIAALESTWLKVLNEKPLHASGTTDYAEQRRDVSLTLSYSLDWAKWVVLKINRSFSFIT